MNTNSRSRLLTIVLVVVLAITLFSSLGTVNAGQELSYSEFLEAVTDGEVESVVFTGASIRGDYAEAEGAEDDGPTSFTSFLPIPSVVGTTGEVEQFLLDNGVTIKAQDDSGGVLGLLLPLLFPLLLFGGFIYFLSRQARGQMGGLGQIGKSKASIHKTDQPQTTFDDIAGYKEVKEEIKEVVAFLRDPSKFRQAGAEVPKGMLMVGPPGTGKTLLAKAVAGEAGVPFISVTGSDFMEMFVGVGASRVRDLFKTARENAPSIIFIDELDSIGRKRGAGMGGGHDEREQTLNQLLGEIDGFQGSTGVVIMAATNRPDVLDSALTRPGRFDRQIVVPLPTLEERDLILKVHMRGKPIAPDVDSTTIARGTPGMAGADLKNLVNESALIAVREGSAEIRMQDFERARERQTIGRERSTLQLGVKEKESVAYHEGGHALAAFLEDEADPVYKVTVLPVGMALGVTTQLPVDERHIHTLSYLLAKIRVMLGGRAAELVALGQPTTGASNDLLQATKLARAIVRDFGMSEAVGPVGYGEDRPVFLGEELGRGAEYSDEFARTVDAEAHRILATNLHQLVERFTELRPGLDSMAALLVEKEAISGKEALEAVKAGLPPTMHHQLIGTASEVRTAPLSSNGHQRTPVGLGVPAGQPIPPANGNGDGVGSSGGVPGSGKPSEPGRGAPPPPPPGAPVPPPR
ncbi:MAG TPA: ATP-dependent zinc metalloprotease FtsH [Euzebya sp.]|nr:ATP-dependent zinc metalloprotease FtsH [Euzebya sp.]